MFNLRPGLVASALHRLNLFSNRAMSRGARPLAAVASATATVSPSDLPLPAVTPVPSTTPSGLRRVTVAEALGTTDAALQYEVLSRKIRADMSLEKLHGATIAHPAPPLTPSPSALAPGAPTAGMAPSPVCSSSAVPEPLDENGVPQKTEIDPTPAQLLKQVEDLLKQLKNALSPDDLPADTDDDEGQALAALKAGKSAVALAHLTKRLRTVDGAWSAKKSGLTAEVASKLRDQVVAKVTLDAARARASDRLFARIRQDREPVFDSAKGPNIVAAPVASTSTPQASDRRKKNDEYRSRLAVLDRQIDAAAAAGFISQEILRSRRQLNQEWLAFNRSQPTS